MNTQKDTAHDSQALTTTIQNNSVLSGPERAAALLLALGEQHGQKIWQSLDDKELRILSSAMCKLGTLESSAVENLLLDFVSKLSSPSTLTGSLDSTERILNKILPKERANAIMEGVRGPAGRNMWEKLSNIQDSILANYLKNEYPQTVALILSKIEPEQTARVISIFPEEFALKVIHRMLKMEPIQKEILEKVERTLHDEFISSLAQTSRNNTCETMAEIFNGFDRQTESRFMLALEESEPEAAEQIKSLMFTFDDLGNLDRGSIQTLLRTIDKNVLLIALKGTSNKLKDFFFSNMSQRASKMIKEDMEIMGPVRLRAVDEAQARMVSFARELADAGEININKNNENEELVY